ncbi:hypothetical protein CTheo_1519 [Ceratobasidium theobromae]|uniref:Uncharacterized protein n=1 Tax=Ceratobasidium theobromae TaxID=1582974 RepID=A0A5N5QTS8_9AGAM|nr:hypothetical protein CTheo_1519 [Ceratobasidium theobromae]
MQFRSRATAVVPPSPSAASSLKSSTRSSATSSAHSDDGASSTSLVYHSEEEYLGDPDVLAHGICDFFGGVPAPKKPKKVKEPKQKPVKAHTIELPITATTTGAQPRDSSSRLRRFCKAIVPVSPSIQMDEPHAHCSHVQSSKA